MVSAAEMVVRAGLVDCLTTEQLWLMTIAAVSEERERYAPLLAAVDEAITCLDHLGQSCLPKPLPASHIIGVRDALIEARKRVTG